MVDGNANSNVQVSVCYFVCYSLFSLFHFRVFFRVLFLQFSTLSVFFFVFVYFSLVCLMRLICFFFFFVSF